MGEVGSVGGGCKHCEGGSVGEGGAEGRCVEGGAVGQREVREVGGEWLCERRVVEWVEGKAVGHVVILLCHPPN